jgi:hypothetical protein
MILPHLSSITTISILKFTNSQFIAFKCHQFHLQYFCMPYQVSIFSHYISISKCLHLFTISQWLFLLFWIFTKLSRVQYMCGSLQIFNSIMLIVKQTLETIHIVLGTLTFTWPYIAIIVQCFIVGKCLLNYYDLKTMLNLFCGWKQKTLIQFCDRAARGMVFQERWKVYFLFIFWLGLLFCKLLWGGLSELVSMMERNPSYSMDTLYELCESRFCKRIGAKLSRERKDKEKGIIYDVGWCRK